MFYICWLTRSRTFISYTASICWYCNLDEENRVDELYFYLSVCVNISCSRWVLHRIRVKLGSQYWSYYWYLYRDWISPSWTELVCSLWTLYDSSRIGNTWQNIHRGDILCTLGCISSVGAYSTQHPLSFTSKSQYFTNLRLIALFHWPVWVSLNTYWYFCWVRQERRQPLAVYPSLFDKGYFPDPLWTCPLT